MNSVNILCQYIFFDKSSHALINNNVMINNRYKNINVTHICLHILWHKYARCHILVTVKIIHNVWILVLNAKETLIIYYQIIIIRK